MPLQELQVFFRMVDYHIKLLNCSLSLLEVEGSGTVACYEAGIFDETASSICETGDEIVKKSQLW